MRYLSILACFMSFIANPYSSWAQGKYKASDSLTVAYDFLTEQPSRAVQYSVNQDGYFRWEINNINLLLYQVEMFEQQNNVVTNQALSQNTLQIDVTPANFNPKLLSISPELLKVIRVDQESSGGYEAERFLIASLNQLYKYRLDYDRRFAFLRFQEESEKQQVADLFQQIETVRRKQSSLDNATMAYLETLEESLSNFSDSLSSMRSQIDSIGIATDVSKLSMSIDKINVDMLHGLDSIGIKISELDKINDGYANQLSSLFQQLKRTNSRVTKLALEQLQHFKEYRDITSRVNTQVERGLGHLLEAQTSWFKARQIEAIANPSSENLQKQEELKFRKRFTDTVLQNLDDYLPKAEQSAEEIWALMDQIRIQLRIKLGTDGSFNASTTDFRDKSLSYFDALHQLEEIAAYYGNLVDILYTDGASLDSLVRERDLASYLHFGTANLTEITTLCWDRYQEVQDRYFAISLVYSEFPPINEGYSERQYRAAIVTYDSASGSDMVAADSILREIERRRALETNLRASKQEIERVMAALELFHRQFLSQDFASFLHELAKVYKAFNPKNFNLTYETYVFSDEADLVNYSLRANPIPNIPNTFTPQPKAIPIDVRLKKGLRLDISSGLMVHLGLADPSFFIQPSDSLPIDSTSLVYIRMDSTNQSSFIPAAGFMLNAYRRGPGNAKLGGSIGASINPTGQVRYYVGLSGIFGRSERIIAHAGWAGGMVNRLAPGYDVDGIYPESTLNGTVPLAAEGRFKSGWFLGVTFNLTANSQSNGRLSVLGL